MLEYMQRIHRETGPRRVAGELADTCILVCLGFIHTLEIIVRILSKVVNRERLCCASTFPSFCICLLVC